MAEAEYASAIVPVRDDIGEAHRAILAYIASPGSWFSGAERVAIAAESRKAERCSLCAARRQSVSPESPDGEHDVASELPASLVEVAHRVRVDSGRLSRRFFEAVTEGGVSEDQYVEAVGIVAMVAGIDHFCRALGVAERDLPEPVPGDPSRDRPASAKPGSAFVSMIAPEEASGPEEGMYGSSAMVPNIARALSLVPDHARMLRRLSGTHYVSLDALGDPKVGRDLDRVQMELVAARVSAMNECFY